MAEHMTPVVAKVLPEEKAAFAAATQLVGTTPSNAIRMFIAAFNRCGTFPFDISPNGAFGAAPDSHQQLGSNLLRFQYRKTACDRKDSGRARHRDVSYG